METKHPLTKLEEELISILIETFKNHGWTIDELPTIFDSDEQKSSVHLNNDDFWDFENFLGVYRQANNLWSNEGEIVLFTENINYVAQAFYDYDNAPIRNPETGELIRRENGEITRKSDLMHYLVEGQNPDYGISLNDSINYLTAIVLIHELTHWMIHWGTDFNQKSLKCEFKYNDDDQKKFHEGLAQYFTDYVINIYGNQKIKELFEFLKGKQSPPYRVFEELKTDLDGNPIYVACVFTALGICWNNNFNQTINVLKYFNFLSVLYYPEEHKKSYHKIVQKEPAFNQTKIIDWWSKNPFSVPDYFLYEYFDSKNKTKYKTSYTSRKFGL
jgi:hypothetical protein